MQPLAVSLANYISTVSARAANPFGAILAGACVLAAPAVALFVVFQKHFVLDADRLGGQGMTVATFPFALTRAGVVMSPLDGRSARGRGRAQPGLRPHARRHAVPAAAARGRGQRLARRARRGASSRTACPVGVERRGVVLAPDEGWERGVGHAGVEDPRVTWVAGARPARHDLRRLRAARARSRRSPSRADLVRWRAPRARCTSPTSRGSTPTSTCSRTRTACGSRSP